MPHPATSCAHNAEAQKLIPGHPVPCRKCGTPIEPEAQAVNEENKVAPGVLNGSYPGRQEA